MLQSDNFFPIRGLAAPVRTQRGYPPHVPVRFEGVGMVLLRWRKDARESRREVEEGSRVSASSIGRYEKGKRYPRADELSQLLEHFGRDLYDLADELAVVQGETPRETPIPTMAISVSADEFPGAKREQVEALLTARRRLLYYEERRKRAEEEATRLRASLLGGRA